MHFVERHTECSTEEPDVWEIRLSGSRRAWAATEVWMRYGGTAGKPGGYQRKQTSSCSPGSLPYYSKMVPCQSGHKVLRFAQAQNPINVV